MDYHCESSSTNSPIKLDDIHLVFAQLDQVLLGILSLREN